MLENKDSKINEDDLKKVSGGTGEMLGSIKNVNYDPTHDIGKKNLGTINDVNYDQTFDIAARNNK